MEFFRTWMLDKAKKEMLGVLLVKVPFLFSGPFGFLGRFFLDKLVVLFVDKVLLGAQDLGTDIDTGIKVKRAHDLIVYFQGADLSPEEKGELDAAYSEVVYDLIELR